MVNPNALTFSLRIRRLPVWWTSSKRKGISGRLDKRQVLASGSNATIVASEMGHAFPAIARVYGDFLRSNALLRR